MAYISGLASNSHQVVHLIHAAMRDEGWTLVSGLQPDGYDSVFHSTGESGNEDIYVRVAAGHHDTSPYGDIQLEKHDGYNGFINMFAYQYFPEAGATNDGTCEIGKFGPVVCLWDRKTSNYAQRFYDFFKGPTQIEHWTPTFYPGVPGRVYDMKWMYCKYGGDSYLRQLNKSRNNISTWAYNTNQSQFYNNVSNSDSNAFIRRSAREPIIYALASGTYAGFNYYNVLTGASNLNYQTSAVPLPPWGTGSTTYCSVIQGMHRDDSGKKIYVFQGGVATSAVATYNVDDNNWTFNGNFYPMGGGCTSVYATKEETGYAHDRIFALKGYNPNYLYSIELDDNGNMVSSMVHNNYSSDAQPPWNVQSYDRIFYTGGTRLFALKGDDQDLYYWDMPTNIADATVGSGYNWALYTTNFYPSYTSPMTLWVQSFLCCRAGVDEYSSTPYWIFVDKDRVILVTETYESSYNGRYEFAYAGLFNSYGEGQIARTTSFTSNGAVTIEVDDVSQFKIGKSYQIIGIEDGIDVTGFNGEVRKIAGAEKITIQSVQQSVSTITISSGLNSDYGIGAKIGEDVQPVGVSMDSIDKIQTINGPISSGNINDSRSRNIYYFNKPQQSIRTQSERTGGYYIWPVVLRHNGYGPTEDSIRGTLKGVYFSASFANESEVLVDGKTYKVFRTEGYTIGDSGDRVAIGPME